MPVTEKGAEPLAQNRFRRANSEETGNRVDGERENYGIKAKRQYAMEQYQPPHFARRDLNIRDLAGHADDIREIGKVAIIRRDFSGEIETPGVFVRIGLAVTIEIVGIAQAEDRVHEQPREHDRRQSKKQVNCQMRLRLGVTDKKCHRKQGCTGHDDNKSENEGASYVLPLRHRAYAVDWSQSDRETHQGENNEGKGIVDSERRAPNGVRPNNHADDRRHNYATKHAMARVHSGNRRNSCIHGEHQTKGLCLGVKRKQILAISPTHS